MKITKRIVAIFSMLFLLTGCMKLNANLTIIDENTMEMSMTMVFEESMLSMTGEDTDTVLDEMMEQFDTDGATVKKIEQTHDGDTYVGIELYGESEDVYGSDFSNSLKVTQENGKEVYTLLLDTEDLNSDSFGTDSLQSYGYSVEQMRKLGVEMNMSITMPYGIIEASHGTIKGDTVTIDLLEVSADEISDITIIAKEGTSTGSSNATYLYLAILVVVIAAVAIFFVLKKQKAEKEQEQQDIAPTDTNQFDSIVAPTSNVNTNTESEVQKENAMETVTEEIAETTAEEVEETEVINETEDTSTSTEQESETTQNSVVDDSNDSQE